MNELVDNGDRVDELDVYREARASEVKPVWHSGGRLSLSADCAVAGLRVLPFVDRISVRLGVLVGVVRILRGRVVFRRSIELAVIR